MTPVLPDQDIWLGAFSRSHPEPLVARTFAPLVRSRRVFLLGWIRQGLLVRTRDRRQQDRLAWTLSGFPDVKVLADDHILAARLIVDHRARVLIDPWRALMWTVAWRMGGTIWSRARSWQALAPLGCPVVSAVAV
jgi:hypothetical protein